MKYHAAFYPLLPKMEVHVQITPDQVKANQLIPPEGGPWRVHTVEVVAIPTARGQGFPMVWCLWEADELAELDADFEEPPGVVFGDQWCNEHGSDVQPGCLECDEAADRRNTAN